MKSPAIFDMDGTLIDSERLAFAALQIVSQRIGCTVSDDVFRSIIGMNRSAGDAILNAELKGAIDVKEFSILWNEEIDRMTDEHMPIKPGVTDGIRALVEAGVPLAVATSTGRKRALEKLRKAELLEAFQVIVCGDEVTRSKPEPDIFIEAARRMDARPEECWAFEDSPNGVRSAVAAGMKVVQIPDLVEPDDALRALGHHIAPSMTEGLIHAGYFGAGHIGSSAA